ncbi:MAG: hypothetical protein PHO64_08650 [Thiomonas sp.]|nr:hypothetical protein [Thiomonas sp.]
MIARRHLAAALPPQAAKYLSRYIDPADAFIAACDGLSVRRAHSLARNAARSFGPSWPDRFPSPLPNHDPDGEDAAQQALENVQSHSLRQVDPAELLCAIEEAIAALEAPGAGARMRQADLDEIDTQAMSEMFGMTQRRAQQIKKAQCEQAQVQGDLFENGGDCNE